MKNKIRNLFTTKKEESDSIKVVSEYQIPAFHSIFYENSFILRSREAKESVDTM